MANSYPNLREYLDSDYARLPGPKIEALMESHGMDAEAMEGFFDDLKKVATSVGQVALKAAPSVISTAAPLIGTAFGGPIGGMIGGSLGSLAGGALASATGQKPPAGGAGGGIGQLLGGLTGGGGGGGIGQLIGGLTGGLTGGSPAAGSLVQNLLKPQTIQALGTMALGSLGKSNIPVGGKDVPVGGFLNMLKTFLGNAEAEYNASQAAADAALPEYLQDYAGLPAGDAASEQFRANALEALLESVSESEASEAFEGESESVSEGMEAEFWNMEMELLESEGYESEAFESEAYEAEAYEAEAD
jgi:hypothetical protein